MRTTIVVILLTCIGVPSCLAGGSTPSVAAQVITANGLKQYTYTLTNDLDPASTIRTFDVFMPESGARTVMSFTCPEPGWWDTFSFRGDHSMWSVIAPVNGGVASGESVIFTLTTPASVPTSYAFKPASYPANWGWDSSKFGNSLLPVPVPEPSSVLGLAGGIAGLGGLVLRRRIGWA